MQSDDAVPAAAAMTEDQSMAYEVTQHRLGEFQEDPDRLPIEREDILDGRGFVLHNVLSPNECQQIIAQMEEFGMQSVDVSGYRRNYRNNHRVAVDGGVVQAVLWERTRCFLPNELNIVADDHYSERVRGKWQPVALNEVFRLCKYFPGGHFSPHYDGDFVRNQEERSFYTFMVYLNTVTEGGCTNFIHEGDRLPADAGLHERYNADPEQVYYKLRPRQGSLVCFRHKVLHEGEPVGDGLKYIMRTDLMFSRVEAPEFTPEQRQAFAWMEEAAKLEAEGNGMEAINFYRKAFKLCPDLEKGMT